MRREPSTNVLARVVSHLGWVALGLEADWAARWPTGTARGGCRPPRPLVLASHAWPQGQPPHRQAECHRGSDHPDPQATRPELGNGKKKDAAPDKISARITQRQSATMFWKITTPAELGGRTTGPCTSGPGRPATRSRNAPRLWVRKRRARQSGRASSTRHTRVTHRYRCRRKTKAPTDVPARRRRAVPCGGKVTRMVAVAASVSPPARPAPPSLT